MFLKYKPTWMVTSIYKITPEQLKSVGIKVVLTDLDNTLIAWDHSDGTNELQVWLEQMKQADIPVVVVSNNSAERISRVTDRLGLSYVARALKPFSFGINKACDQLDVDKKEVVMVGDQLMTDIKAANSAGVRSILVKPVVDTDGWKTRFNRFFERRVMKYLQRKYSEMKWQGEIK
ncbi:YqeG family HAD IIIA-type phosphatase [Tetragenococcus koreensis]|uniref:HAD family hydrolase n=1 Tax=Tetragenococcus koreensis TaxID=290335 RepID=A0AAN4UA27_9ENTE|nr:YqeG family HAD IIIA-type phosphatase [Tetragenococcus koreensis]AYW44896.1 YqeG family HAD IIIA-type phosphatase [Tetragenococcus koreensis]MCF1584604.1 YqeG family HAD IIIA-type phosphatase [Tetragenococcus koreensis]MCF1614156.1 YqeG family HAD IIIA-type phosphatase [Tetragenococcus koreensis]MCF1617394.1 YqeG family HAD IIIA-type phosphatase [Tetragenococcus koreensis]MCF1619692.1 YqeG family HAD IIIA-type phosphatase [Tetragenococcus koreensis]